MQKMMLFVEEFKCFQLPCQYFADGAYKHENMGLFFDENGAKNISRLAQGKERIGSDVFDDYY